VLTLFSIPKAFAGETSRVQCNAVSSWLALDPSVQVVLVGDEPGVAGAATELGAERVPNVKRGAGGTPRLDDAFLRVDAVARYPLRCFVNADVVLLDDFLPALRRLASWRNRWLAVGRTCDVVLPQDVTGRAQWRELVRRRAAERGVLRGAAAIDWFVFPCDLFAGLPPFAVGRAAWDNWVLWRARERRVPVIDVTSDVLSVHQSHDYGHLAGGKVEAYWGAEAQRNRELAGGRAHIYSICDATHRLRHGRVERNPGAVLRSAELLRRARWKLGLERTP
jgi:hypothetical protein